MTGQFGVFLVNLRQSETQTQEKDTITNYQSITLIIM